MNEVYYRQFHTDALIWRWSLFHMRVWSLCGAGAGSIAVSVRRRVASRCLGPSVCRVSASRTRTQKKTSRNTHNDMREASLLRPARPDFLLYSPLLLLSIIIVVCSPGWALALYFQFPTHLLTFLAYFHFLIVGWKPRNPPETLRKPFHYARGNPS